MDEDFVRYQRWDVEWVIVNIHANAERRERPYQIRRAMLLTRGTRRRRYPRPLQRWRTVSLHPRHHLFLGRRIPKQPRQQWIVKGHPTTDFAD